MISCFLNQLGGWNSNFFFLGSHVRNTAVFLLHSVMQISLITRNVQSPGVFCTLSIVQQFHGVELLEIPTAGSISKAASVQKELLYHWFHHLNSARLTEGGKYIRGKLESRPICSSKLLMPVDPNALCQTKADTTLCLQMCWEGLQQSGMRWSWKGPVIVYCWNLSICHTNYINLLCLLIFDFECLVFYCQSSKTDISHIHQANLLIYLVLCQPDMGLAKILGSTFFWSRKLQLAA